MLDQLVRSYDRPDLTMDGLAEMAVAQTMVLMMMTTTTKAMLMILGMMSLAMVRSLYPCCPSMHWYCYGRSTVVSLLQLDHWDIYTFCWFSQRLLLRNYLFGPYQMTHIARNCYQSWNDFAYSVCLSLDLGVVLGEWENFVRVLCCVCVLSGCSNAVWPKKWTKDLNGSRRYCLWWPFWIIF